MGFRAVRLGGIAHACRSIREFSAILEFCSTACATRFEHPRAAYQPRLDASSLTLICFCESVLGHGAARWDRVGCVEVISERGSSRDGRVSYHAGCGFQTRRAWSAAVLCSGRQRRVQAGEGRGFARHSFSVGPGSPGMRTVVGWCWFLELSSSLSVGLPCGTVLRQPHHGDGITHHRSHHATAADADRSVECVWQPGTARHCRGLRVGR